MRLNDLLERNDELRPIKNYMLLMIFMVENNIKKEDLAIACQIFLYIHSHIDD